MRPTVGHPPPPLYGGCGIVSVAKARWSGHHLVACTMVEAVHLPIINRVLSVSASNLFSCDRNHEIGICKVHNSLDNDCLCHSMFNIELLLLLVSVVLMPSHILYCYPRLLAVY